jgi:type III restriction enzyme
MKATPLKSSKHLESEMSDILFDWSIPSSIAGNLRQSFSIRPYQQEAFASFDSVWRNTGKKQLSDSTNDYIENGKSTSNHFLFHMATGSGKTLIMAGLILYLYEKGYRNFLFFVNSTNIIDKTKDNFLNSSSSKYLFSNRIVIGGKVVKIKTVDNFQDKSDDDINIIFSTIQGLHAGLNTPRENSVTFEDFENEKTVLISDESHHINAETKRRSELKGDEKNNILTWENTVEEIFQSNADNVLLEFTATIDFSISSIAEKYKDKLIYDYPLRRFRRDGYSKEVVLIQTDLPLFERALVALLVSQFRKEVYREHGLKIKPVILFKSKTIKESLEFYNLFIERLRDLKAKKLLDVLSKIDQENQVRLRKLFGQKDENLDMLINELQHDFDVSKLLIVNSKEESEGRQLMVNSLEEARNPYRAIFAVDKLNEGWDVLNLFDIVRLHDEADSSPSKNKKTTISEAQLIGRGARYCPFQLSPNDPLYQRKYDDRVDHPLRICEQLYYHSPYNPAYIQDLDIALEDIGIKEQISNLDSDINAQKAKLNEFQKIVIDNSSEEYSFGKLVKSLSLKIDSSEKNKSTKEWASEKTSDIGEIKTQPIYLKDIDIHIIQKVINTLPFYEFYNLKKYLPSLGSMREFINSSDYLGGLKVELEYDDQDKIQLQSFDYLYITSQVLARVEEELRKRVVVVN